MTLWERWLYRKIDISSLIFFRIVFGLLALYEVIDLLDGLGRSRWKALTGYYDFNFTYYGFDWVKPLPSEALFALCIFMGILSLSILVGYAYRLCALIYGLCFTYIYLIEKAYYLNHGYLFAVLCFVMALLPANRALSVDARLNPSIKTQLIPYWPVFLLQFLMGVVYFYGGLAKINPDWLRGIPLTYWLDGSSEDIPFIGHILELDWVGVFMSYGGLLLDLTAVFFLTKKRTRGYFLLAVIFFHGMNKLIFQIGIFPYMSTALTLMYFSPDWPRKILHRFLPEHVAPLATQEATPPALISSIWRRRLLVGFLIIFCSYNLLFPFRHFFIEGVADWTEEGHRYSWHMMLRSKKGKGRFTVKIPSEDKIIKISTKKYLNSRQRKKMFTHPEMILQFAHFLRDKYEKKGYKDVEVYANVKCRFNGRDYANIVKKDIDLAKVACCKPWKHDDWILTRDDVRDHQHLKQKKGKEPIIEDEDGQNQEEDTIIHEETIKETHSNERE